MTDEEYVKAMRANNETIDQFLYGPDGKNCSRTLRLSAHAIKQLVAYLQSRLNDPVSITTTYSVDGAHICVTGWMEHGHKVKMEF